MNNPMKITFEDGSRQIIRPTQAFDGNYHALAHAIANGKKHSYRILKDKKETDES